MKKGSILLIILFQILFPAKANTLTLAGNLPAIANETVRLQYLATPYQTEINEALFEVNGKGAFKMKVDFWEGQLITLISSKIVFRFYAGSNDSLYLTLKKANGKEDYFFSGRGANTANYSVNQLEYFKNSFENASFSLNLINEMSYRSAGNFKVYCDSLAAVKNKYLNQHKDKLPADFYQWQLAENIYQFLNIKINYPVWFYTMRGIENKQLEVDSGYYKFLKTVEVNNDQYIHSPEYRYFLKYYFIHQSGKTNEKPTALLAYQLSSKYFTGQALRVFQLQLWNEIIQYGNFSDATLLHDQLKKLYDGNKDFELIEARYTERLPFTIGAKAPGFTLPDLNGAKVSLESYTGKVVYIDFWASWCGPCMAEMPASEKLKKHFEGKDVVFINVSIDDDEGNWRVSQEKNQVTGINLICKNNEDNVVKKYQINSIPAYFLIDKKGNFIAAPAQRPSRDFIYQQIQDALGK